MHVHVHPPLPPLQGRQHFLAVARRGLLLCRAVAQTCLTDHMYEVEPEVPSLQHLACALCVANVPSHEGQDGLGAGVDPPIHNSASSLSSASFPIRGTL